MMCPKSHSKNEEGRIQVWRASFCFCPPGVSGPPQSIGAPFSCDPGLPPPQVAGSGVGTRDKQGQERSWGRRGLCSVCWGG